VQKTPAPLLPINRAAALDSKGYRTLLIDIDPQAQVTAWLNLDDRLSSPGTIVISMAKQRDRPGMQWRRGRNYDTGNLGHLSRPSAIIPEQSRGALARNLLEALLCRSVRNLY
jgi:cellulose biosynthesis protein BcsQ